MTIIENKVKKTLQIGLKLKKKRSLKGPTTLRNDQIFGLKPRKSS